jgi:hypothetical protein
MLNYGTKSQRLIPNPSPSHAQLYTYSKENETELAFAGRLSHKLAMQKAQEDITGADKALEKLQSQLAGYKQEKASNQSVALLPALLHLSQAVLTFTLQN